MVEPLKPTVVICTRDRPYDLRRCLISVLANRPSNCPVVIVDQSRDVRSAAVFHEIVGDAEAFTYLESDRKGLSAARNDGAAHADADFVLFTDDDCEITPDWVGSWCRFFENNVGVGMGFGRVQVAPYDPETGHIPGFDPGVEARLWGLEMFSWNTERSRRRMTGAECVGMGANIALRQDAFAAAGGFDELLGVGAHFPAAEELDLAFRILRVGYLIGQTARPSVVHHGFRDTSEASRLAQGYATGISAMYVKHLRCRDARAAVLIARDGVRLATRVGRAALTGERPTGFNGLRAFVRGLPAAANFPIDIAHRVFVVPSAGSASPTGRAIMADALPSPGGWIHGSPANVDLMRLSVDSHASNHPSSPRTAKIVVPLVLEMTGARNVVDVGCGIGAWVAEFLANGVDARGIDGSYIPSEALLVPASHFSSCDLSQPVCLDSHFDLVVSLEVAEHLPPSSAETFVSSLVGLGNIVLFSAAIPNQIGPGHVNEQWPGYWSDLFAEHGYQGFDCIRPVVWDNPEVGSWYAQNTILYANAEGAAVLKNPPVPGRPKSLVHPSPWLERTQPVPTVGLRTLPAVIVKSIGSWGRRRAADSLRYGRSWTNGGSDTNRTSAELSPDH